MESVFKASGTQHAVVRGNESRYNISAYSKVRNLFKIVFNSRGVKNSIQRDLTMYRVAVKELSGRACVLSDTCPDFKPVLCKKGDK